MSRIQDIDPTGGDGPNKGDELSGDRATGTGGERRQDEGRGEQEGRGEGDDSPQTASKGANPVQHSE